MISELIPFGWEHAVSRAQLRIRSGLVDRMVRKQLQKEAEDGALVLNLQDGHGYFRLPEDVTTWSEWDVLAAHVFIQQEKAKAESILRRIAPVEKAYTQQRLLERSRSKERKEEAVS